MFTPYADLADVIDTVLENHLPRAGKSILRQLREDLIDSLDGDYISVVRDEDDEELDSDEVEDEDVGED